MAHCKLHAAWFYKVQTNPVRLYPVYPCILGLMLLLFPDSPSYVTPHDDLRKTVMQGTVEGGLRRGRQCMTWSDNVKTWTDMSAPQLLTVTVDRAFLGETVCLCFLRCQVPHPTPPPPHPAPSPPPPPPKQKTKKKRLVQSR